MTATTTRVRERIEAQGFLGLDDATLSQLDYPLRLAPAICLLWTALGTALGSPAALWALVPLALLGVVLPGHPFDVLYQLSIRRVLGTAPIPPYPMPRRFSCLLATFFLAGAAVAFGAGVPILGHLLGWTIVSLALVNVTTGFCAASYLYGRLFGKPACGC